MIFPTEVLGFPGACVARLGLALGWASPAGFCAAPFPTESLGIRGDWAGASHQYIFPTVPLGIRLGLLTSIYFLLFH